MGIRLYDSAWVVVEGLEQPLQVRKDPRNPAAFTVGDHQYDIDGRPIKNLDLVPRITAIHSLQSAREAGLRIHYDGNADPAI
ncbi:hypothetical protein [Asticcacaulis sp. 201]|uniref:hypothetical protein n=1 Tax=Asticcacaulis sp. 201 TaxID=3028787 RepID=UPI0029163BBB|nr:hypothetical protein [Asticcacaulis sp. 201]MDV6331057.1 hypothetical protein [Asticcacaulis sp. 201]